jgi:glyoxylase-like metal-dependent hydrolase (beta-lactamase superfamily II)
MLRRFFTIGLLCNLFVTAGIAHAAQAFNAAALAHDGDNVAYGSYVVYRVGNGIYKINDPGVKTGKGGAWGVDSYLVVGKARAFMVDLGNNYIDGYPQDLIAPRKDAAEQFRAIAFGLAGKRPLEIGVTHMHPDHDGMTGAFVEKHRNAGHRVTLLMPEHEDPNALMAQYQISSDVYSRFEPGHVFDLGGGRKLTALQVRGHTAGSTVYLLTPEMYLFTGDSIGSGFGQAFPKVETLKVFAQDSQQLVDYINGHFTPWQRYALKVFTGHSWQNVYAGWWSPNHAKIDVGYLDWRFVQDVASAANGIVQGKWLVPGSGLQYVGNMEYTDAWPTAAGRAIMVYGSGTVITTLEAAYEAAGIPMPAAQEEPRPQ